MSKIILDLCGGTGSWSKPYKDAGYDVRLVTLPEFNVLHTAISSETITFLSTGGIDMTINLVDVYGILGAPPCTMFSRARSTGKPREFDGAISIVQACLEIVWRCRSVNQKGKLHQGLKFWALENPMGLLRQFLGNPPNSFRGWEYGDDHVKFTDLWGYYKMPTKKFKEPVRFNMRSYSSPKPPPEYAHLKLDRAGIRAITPSGFAKAFYKANR